MAAGKNKWISIMIVPEDGAGVRNWRFSSRIYSLLKIGLGMVLMLLIAGFASMAGLGVMFLHVQHLKKTNKDLLDATVKIEVINKRLAEFEQKEQKLRSILGSDLSIPRQVSLAQGTSSEEPGTEGGASPEAYGLEGLIAREESKLRRIPSIWPVDVWQITQKFRNTGNARLDHYGIDILSREKSPVVATADGKVTYADMSEKLGLRIVIDHGNGWVTEYGHNASLLVKYGDEVKKGQTIAIFGGTDKGSSGPHLHYAVYYNKQPINPLENLKQKWNLMESIQKE